MSSALVFSGEINFFDWGIDYDKIVTGKLDAVPTKILYMNMQVSLEDSS